MNLLRRRSALCSLSMVSAAATLAVAGTVSLLSSPAVAKPLKVASVNGLTASSSGIRNVTLAWKPASGACAYRITVATTAGFSGARTYTSRSTVPRFTVPGLVARTRYYFRVAGTCGKTVGPAATQTAVMAAKTEPVVLGSFNIHKDSPDMRLTASRFNLVLNTLASARYDVVGVQETNTATREAIASRLGNLYTVANIWDARGHNNTGGAVFYRPDVLTPSRAGKLIPLPSPDGFGGRNGLAQEFVDNSSGAKFVFVSIHLTNGPGKANTLARQAQTQTLLRGANAYNKSHLPIVYSGDFNSNQGKKYIFDAPTKVFAAANIGNAITTAPTVVNGTYNSSNYLTAKPSFGGYHVDKMFTDGMAVTKWEMLVRLNGRNYATPFASDHNALRVTVGIPY